MTLTNASLREAQRRLSESGIDAFVLSTCLRVELVVAGDDRLASEALDMLYADPALFDVATVRTDGEAFAFLCRLAAGLESPIVGEREVFAQFRQAVSACQESSAPSSRLIQVLSRAVGVARSVRRHLSGPDGSLAATAARSVADFERVAVLGSERWPGRPPLQSVPPSRCSPAGRTR